MEHNKDLIESTGVIISLVGARFQRPGQMEYQDICVSEEQNTLTNFYGRKPDKLDSFEAESKYDFRSVWNDFYEEKSLLFNETSFNNKRFTDISGKRIFDNVAMKKRFAISFDTLLLESHSRALQANKMAFVHVVGIRLGVWMITDQQEEIFLRVFEQRLKFLADKLTNIGWVNFAWFDMTECGDIKDGNVIKSGGNKNGIKIFMSNRNPADKLVLFVKTYSQHFNFVVVFLTQIEDEFANSLLVVSYAGDGNALPGNEFWIEFLDTSSDPAAACSTLIADLHNPHINTSMVSGSNLHIASAEFGINHIADYVKKII